MLMLCVKTSFDDVGDVFNPLTLWADHVVIFSPALAAVFREDRASVDLVASIERVPDELLPEALEELRRESL